MSAAEDRTPEEIEAEIEAARSDLGDTVADIADKADVKKQAGKQVSKAKAQTKAKVEETKAAVAEKVEDVKSAVSDKTDDVKSAVSDKTDDVKSKSEDLKESVAGSTDRFGGSGGDIGSGPTGDVRNSKEIVDDHRNRVIIAAAASFAIGLVTGYAMGR